MLNLKALFSKKADLVLKDQIAELLKVSPERLEEFEKAYQTAALSDGADPDDFFGTSSKQTSQSLRESFVLPEKFNEEALVSMINTITDGLCEKTPRLEVKNGMPSFMPLLTGSSSNPQVTKEMIRALPEAIRPQLTDSLMMHQLDNRGKSTSDMLFLWLLRLRDEKDPKKRRVYYHQFRQGLDILDLDELTYRMLGMNRNSMSYWLPAISIAATKHGFFRIPETKIAKVPMPLLQLSRLDYGSLTPTTLKIVDDWAMKAFDLDVNKTYFIKTGTYSSKFDFRNAKVTGEKEVQELGEYLLFIQNQAVEMAGPLTQPSIYGVSTTNEWVVREFIEDVENNPCIYKGLPLHTEYRIFVDFDTDEVLGISPYWEPETMKRRFGEGNDASSPHQRHDYIIYKMHEDVLMGRYHENKEKVLKAVQDLLPDVDLEGQWSIDIMQNGDDFWLIDMATADTSALNECIPAGKLKKSPENWIPELD